MRTQPADGPNEAQGEQHKYSHPTHADTQDQYRLPSDLSQGLAIAESTESLDRLERPPCLNYVAEGHPEEFAMPNRSSSEISRESARASESSMARFSENLGAKKPLPIPGQPNVSASDRDAVLKFLERELKTEELDKLYPYLWLVAGKGNISPLHHQTIKGRRVLITEDPGLHLVWYYDQIYIKPIPLCLLDTAFFSRFLLSESQQNKSNSDFEALPAAYGFLRSYTKLIVHESDLRIALELQLIPSNITWEQWCDFVRQYEYIPDSSVNRRYQYGELRLTRLNFYSKIFLFKWSYFETYTQYTSYFMRFIGPYLFVFGSLSVILSAMQLELTAEKKISTSYAELAGWFSSFSIWITVTGLAFFPVLYAFFQLRELLHVICYSIRSRTKQEKH